MLPILQAPRLALAGCEILTSSNTSSPGGTMPSGQQSLHTRPNVDRGAVEMSVVTQCGSLKCLEDSLTNLLHDIRDLRVGDIPRSLDLEAAPTVDQWSHGLIPARCLVGSVRGHPIRARVHTSQLVMIDPEHGWARTWSRYYRLGTREGPATAFGTS